MRVCQNCQTENEDNARQCVSCQTRLRRRERAPDEIPESPYSPRGDPINRPTLFAFYLALWGLIPFVGMILGPVACILATRAYRTAKGQPGYLATPQAHAAFWIGLVEAVCQWLGALCFYLGLAW